MKWASLLQFVKIQFNQDQSPNVQFIFFHFLTSNAGIKEIQFNFEFTSKKSADEYF